MLSIFSAVGRPICGQFGGLPAQKQIGHVYRKVNAMRAYLLHAVTQILQIRVGLVQVWVFVLVGFDPFIGGLNGRLHQPDAFGSVCDVDVVNDGPGDQRVVLQDLLEGGAYQVQLWKQNTK